MNLSDDYNNVERFTLTIDPDGGPTEEKVANLILEDRLEIDEKVVSWSSMDDNSATIQQMRVEIIGIEVNLYSVENALTSFTRKDPAGLIANELSFYKNTAVPTLLNKIG